MKYSIALLSALLSTLTSTAYGAVLPVLPRDAPQNYAVTVDDVTGFIPDRLFNVKPGDQVTFYMQGDADHQVVQAVPQDYCVPVAGGLDSGIR
jgi:plastocyanin